MKLGLVITPDGPRRQALLKLLEYGYRCDYSAKPNALLESISSDRWFTQCRAAPSLSQGLALIIESPAPMCVLVDNELPHSEITQFLDDARSSTHGATSAYILLVTSRDLLARRIAENLVVGFHGFLAEPYTIEKTREAIALAEKVLDQGSLHRLKTATSLMIRDSLVTSPELMAEGEQDCPEADYARRLAHSYNHLRELSGVSLCSPVVKELQPLRPMEREQRFHVLLEDVRERVVRTLRSRSG